MMEAATRAFCHRCFISARKRLGSFGWAMTPLLPEWLHRTATLGRALRCVDQSHRCGCPPRSGPFHAARAAPAPCAHPPLGLGGRIPRRPPNLYGLAPRQRFICRGRRCSPHGSPCEACGSPVARTESRQSAGRSPELPELPGDAHGEAGKRGRTLDRAERGKVIRGREPGADSRADYPVHPSRKDAPCGELA